MATDTSRASLNRWWVNSIGSAVCEQPAELQVRLPRPPIALFVFDAELVAALYIR